MKRLIAVLALFLCAPLMFAADLTGIWLYSAKQPDGHTTRLVLSLQQSGNNLAGKIEHPWGALNIKEGKVDGNNFSITAPISDGRPYICEGKLDGDKLHFTVRDPNAKPYDVVAVRSNSDPFRIAMPLTPPAVRDLSGQRAWRRLHLWDGTVGTSSPDASTTRSCARWPTPWSPAACATPATSTSTSTTPGRATATPTASFRPTTSSPT